MIIVGIFGGLGNQMFQYAIGRRLSFFNNVPLKLDIQWYQDQGEATHREYHLDKFNIQGDIASPEEIERLKAIPNQFLLRTGKKILRRFSPYRRNSFIIQRDHRFVHIN